MDPSGPGLRRSIGLGPFFVQYTIRATTRSLAGPSTLLRRVHITRAPHAKRSVLGNGSVAASLGFFVQVVHDLACARTAGSAAVQVAMPSHPDEGEVGAASRALHVWRERVEPHGRRWHFLTPPSLALPAQHAVRASRGMPGSTSRNSSRHEPSGCGSRPAAGRTSSRHTGRWRTGSTRPTLASRPLRRLTAGTLQPGPHQPRANLRADGARPSVLHGVNGIALAGNLSHAAV